MTFCQKDFFFYNTYFLATKIVDKGQCESGCSNLTWDIGYGRMPFLKDFEGMYFKSLAPYSPQFGRAKLVFVAKILDSKMK